MQNNSGDIEEVHLKFQRDTWADSDRGSLPGSENCSFFHFTGSQRLHIC